MMPQADSLTCPIRPEETELAVLRMLTTRDNSRSQPRRVGVRSRLAAQRPAKPLTLCDGHGVDFVTVTGQILMAAHI
jgi:hypothetical protein